MSFDNILTSAPFFFFFLFKKIQLMLHVVWWQGMDIQAPDSTTRFIEH
jgi:hypothetical protein